MRIKGELSNFSVAFPRQTCMLYDSLTSRFFGKDTMTW